MEKKKVVMIPRIIRKDVTSMSQQDRRSKVRQESRKTNAMNC